MARSRQIKLSVSEEHGRFIDKELLRLKNEYGISLNASEFIIALLENHLQKIKLVATEAPESVYWCYKYLREDGK